MKRIQIGDLSRNERLVNNDLSMVFGGRMDESRRKTKIEGRHAQGSLADYINGGGGSSSGSSGGGSSSSGGGCTGYVVNDGSIRLVNTCNPYAS